MDRREFISVLGTTIAAASLVTQRQAFAATATDSARDAHLYDLPAAEPNSVCLMHITDCHAQLLPLWFREPSVNLGVGEMAARPPHLVDDAFLSYYGVPRNSALAYAFTSVGFVEAARSYGRVGGFAHLAGLVKRVRAARPGALLLDGGDTWQGSASALWTKGQDMVEAAKLLGVDIMTGHWEFTLGAARVKEIVENDFKGSIEFLAQNVRSADFDDAVFPASSLRTINGVATGIIGQAFPYTPIANPRYFVPDWTFGIQEKTLQEEVERLRSRGAVVVVLLSHNGMDVDLKLASRVTGIDAILGGHTHDAIPRPVIVGNRSGKTLVTNAGSNGKFLGVLDFKVRDGKVSDYDYRLLPVFSNLLPADPAMSQLIEKVRAPFISKLTEPLATSDELLFRRGNFNGSFDQLVLDALMAVKGAPIAFSPGFRWGTSVLPGETITFERVMEQTAITYPMTTLTPMTGSTIKLILEDVCDNLFNPDPYYQQGGDMVRVGGLSYTCTPGAAIGARIGNMRLDGVAIEADKTYPVAGWAPVAETSRELSATPIWDIVAEYLRGHSRVHISPINTPALVGVEGNPGLAGVAGGSAS